MDSITIPQKVVKYIEVKKVSSYDSIQAYKTILEANNDTYILPILIQKKP